MGGSLVVQRKVYFEFDAIVRVVFGTRLLLQQNLRHYLKEYTSPELPHTRYIHFLGKVFHLCIENNYPEENLLPNIALGRKLEKKKKYRRERLLKIELFSLS
jgi:hypothetical protein